MTGVRVDLTDLRVTRGGTRVLEGFGLSVEPGGAVGLAALLTGKIEPIAGTVVVLSGGNIDPSLHARILAEAA